MDLLTFLFLILLVWTCIHFLQTRNTKLPPGPIPLPIVGSLLKLGSKPNESLAQFAQLYGPLMTLQLGSLTTLVVSTATMANQLLLKHDLIFSGRTVPDSVRVLRHQESSVVWMPPNPLWRSLRTLLNTQIMTVQRLDANIALRRAKVQKLVSHVGDCSVTQREVDIGRAGFITILNLISNTVFSVDLADLGSPAEEAQEFKDVVLGILEEAGKPNVSDYLPFLRWMDLQGVRRRSIGYFEKLHHLFDEMIDGRLRDRSSGGYSRRGDFLDVLLDQNEEKGFQLKRHEVKALLADIFVAGSDTSSATIEWAMAELLRNPHTMSMVRSELKEAIAKGKQVEESDIARLPYLQAVVKEALRLHPPVPLIPHRAESTVEICGFTIPKYTQVIVNAWAIGRDPNVWTNPTCFLPERFLHSKLDFKGQDCQFIPFGAGRRICPGSPLAFRMVHLSLASLLHSFAWKLPNGMLPEGMNMDDKFGITLQMEAPLLAVPVQE
ncbi:hypothetical protein MRB53_026996 [Persea americana]|uniref:Uncharacterized protein n=1 Tax=Persea americana TaxID=3435 RepID=A0ACC2LJM3_PERAE|nr:hypothetical protein MRB53_026996 [Persea americana]